MRYGFLITVIRTRTGGRQGCKVGATVFNAAYSEALHELRESLMHHGIHLSVRYPTGVFWGPAAPSDPETPILGVTFVDDECIMLVCSRPALLDHCIEILLASVIRIFHKYALKLNWSAGKSECCVKYRGKDAVKTYEAHRMDCSIA